MKGIFTSDWHLRKDRPRCRLDKDWMETQAKAVRFIIHEANKRKCPIFHNGDLFNSAKVDPVVSNMLHRELQALIEKMWIIAGNHDLPFHSWDLVHQASIFPFLSGTTTGNTPSVFPGASNFGTEEREEEIMFIHQLVFPGFDLPPESGGISSRELMRKYPSAKWIFTGDNHNGFHDHYKGQTLVNPGCMLRQSAALKDYTPVCYFVDTEDAIIEIPIPDDETLITDEYLQKEEEKEARIEAFIEKIQSKTEITLSFKDNMKLAMENKKLSPETVKTTRKILENGGIYGC